jgi:hypothetical protein
MKNTMKITVIAALASLAAVQAWADQTNLVRNLDIELVGVQQGGTTTSRNITTTTVDKVKLDTADVINAIGSATGNTFSPRARLVVITPLANGSVTMAIRDGGNSVDVSGFFVQSYLSDAVGRSTVNNRTGRSNGSNYSFQRFELQDADGNQPLALHYSVSGVAVENFSIPAIPGPSSELSADVSGTGDSAGKLLILQGTIRVYGETIEVVPGNPTPPV